MYYYDALIVLKSAPVPAVLLEAGIIVNRDEERSLADPKTQRKIAEAVAAGLGCLDERGPSTQPSPG